MAGLETAPRTPRVEGVATGAGAAPAPGAPTRRGSPTRRGRRRVVASVLVATGAGALTLAVLQTADAVDSSPPAESGLTLTLVGAVAGPHGPNYVTLPELVGLRPGDERTFTLDIANDATTSLELDSAFAWAPEPSDVAFLDAPSVRVVGVPASLEPGASAEATVTVRAPEEWDPANVGRVGAVVVRVTGTS